MINRETTWREHQERKRISLACKIKDSIMTTTKQNILDFFTTVCDGIRLEYEQGASKRSFDIDWNTLNVMLEAYKDNIIKGHIK